jgi:hypothetical protein
LHLASSIGDATLLQIIRFGRCEGPAVPELTCSDGIKLNERDLRPHHSFVWLSGLWGPWIAFRVAAMRLDINSLAVALILSFAPLFQKLR